MTRTSLRLLSASLAASALLAIPASSADKPARIKAMSIKATNATKELRVISTDGKTWNAFGADAVPFRAALNIETKGTGFVKYIGVALGRCGDKQCYYFPRLLKRGIEERDWSREVDLTFGGDELPLGGAQSIPVTPYGSAILAACNAKLSPDGPTRRHSFDQTLTATFIAETSREAVANPTFPEVPDDMFPYNNLVWRHDDFTVKVNCVPIKKDNVVNDVAAPMPEFKATDVKLFLATFRSNQGGNAASKCRALRVTTRVQTTKTGNVDVKLWRKAGNGPTTSSLHSVWSSYDAAKNGYFADIVKGEFFDAVTNVQYMAEVVGGTFAPSTPWKDVTIHCTGAGGGGLANDLPDAVDPEIPQPKPEPPKPQFDPPANDLANPGRPDPDAPKPAWAGTVTLADSAGAHKRCPRKGQAVFAVTRNEPGQFKYKLSCSNGQGFSGSVQSFNQGSGVFEAYGAYDLKVNRTRTIQCTLQEVRASGARVTIDKGSFAYTCNNPAIDPQADDLAAPPKPTHNQGKPDVSIFCKPGFKLVGKKCLKKPEITILCRKGFQLVGKKCVKKPVVSILCVKGFKPVDGKCVKTR